MVGRKELKFLCNEQLLVQIENRIKGIMKRDIHQSGSSYNIRSIYFDSPDNRCFQDNESGIGTRSKYRLRIYNFSDSLIKAEIKNKYYDATYKESTVISKDQFKACISAGSVEAITGNCANRDDAIYKMASKIVACGYRPAAIVEYERTTYTYSPCNVRVTFDRNIAAGMDYSSIFDRKMPVRPVCDRGYHILEVKYDEFLPEYLRMLLNPSDMRRTSFSKYYLARLVLGNF